MSLFGISQEGIESMRKLANDLRSSAEGLLDANKTLKRNISTNMNELGVYGTEIWALTLQLDGFLEDRTDAIDLLAQKAQSKANEIVEILGFDNVSGSGCSGNNLSSTQNQTGSYHRTSETISDISKWIDEINPNYNSPFYPIKNPYRRNCGSCAFAVESRLLGMDTSATASSENIGTDAGMEAATGKKCIYMSPEDIEKTLLGIGTGAHLIVGINRYPTAMGKPQAGHWFNAYYDGNRIYTIDGQSGKILDWPHDYNDVSEWCALV